MQTIFVATIGEAFAGAFGATAALLLIGGGLFLRGQQARLRFRLTELAMEKGLTPPAGLPVWLGSLRQAVIIVAIGVGLFVVGFGLLGAAKHVEPHAGGATTRPTAMVTPEAVDVPRVPAPAAEPAPLDHRPPQPPPPPPRDPVAEARDQARALGAIGFSAMACGFVLVLLGGVRVVFAFVERRYTAV